MSGTAGKECSKATPKNMEAATPANSLLRNTLSDNLTLSYSLAMHFSVYSLRLSLSIARERNRFLENLSAQLIALGKILLNDALCNASSANLAHMPNLVIYFLALIINSLVFIINYTILTDKSTIISVFFCLSYR